MDDLLELMDNTSPVEDNAIINDEHLSRIYPSTKHFKLNSTGDAACHRATNGLSHSTIDPLTKIRIVDRKMSKVDVSDFLAPYSFSTTAVLASMSNQKLFSILLPSSGNSNSTNLSGRTCAATMGIIFKNSGTRISKSSGRAFTILTIGDLHTGPTVSFLLFGQAYAKFTTTLKPGNVVAFVGMSLMPMKDNYGKETRISFSVNDVEQVVFVGKSLDYGVCAGCVTASNGDARSCSKYVDLRIGKYCQYHINQQVTKNKNIPSSSRQLVHSSRNNKGKFNTIQLLKAEKAEKRLLRRQMLINNQSDSNSLQHHLFNNTGTTVKGSGSVSESTLTQPMNSGNKYQHSLKNVPMHMKKLQNNILNSVSSSINDNRTKKNINNPYAKRNSHQKLPETDIDQDFRTKRNNCKEDILAQSLNVSKLGVKSSIKHTFSKLVSRDWHGKRKHIPMNTDGFDGQVSIPKPNPLFTSRRSKDSAYIVGLTKLPPSLSAGPSPQEKASMMSRQKAIADQMRLNKVLPKKTDSKSKEIDNNADSFGDLLGMGATLNDSQRAKLLETNSKYENEASAALFAKSRAYLNELEKKENSHDKRRAKKRDIQNCNSSLENKIMSIWTCVNCNRTTRIKPGICIRQSHNVKRRREVKEKETIVEKRLGLKTKSISDGGLVLGAGLEWSGWKGCS